MSRESGVRYMLVYNARSIELLQLRFRFGGGSPYAEDRGGL